MSRKYSRRNYVEILEEILPDIYQEKDLELASIQKDLSYEILEADTTLVTKFAELNKSIRPLIENYTDYFGLGPWNTVDYSEQHAFPSVAAESGYAEGLVKYFIPQNKLTHIEPDEFVLEIVDPLGFDLLDYSTSAEFHAFFKDTLFPKLTIGEGSYFTDTVPGVFFDVHENTGQVFGSTFKDTVRYLINSLGLFQLINYKTDDSSVWDSIREATADVFTDKIFLKREAVTLEDAVNVLKRVHFENLSTGIFDKIFEEGGSFEVDSENQFLSGTQSLSKQYTWNSLLYGIDEQEQDDTFTKDYYTGFFVDKFVLNKEVTEGPFKKFLKAVGFLIGDIDNQVLTLNTLASIDECPAKFLPYLADTIGWKFYTNNSDSWRRQLREARAVLQQKGTKQGLINILKLVLPSANIDFDSGYKEYYESYLPNLIYYMLKTESVLLKSESTWTQSLANEFAGGEFNPSNVDQSIRYVVDHILLDAAMNFPEMFRNNGRMFEPHNPRFRFNHRGRAFPMPPWEYEEFYDECDISEDLIDFISEQLFCLGVDAAQVDLFKQYVIDNTIRSIDDKHYNCGFTFLTNTIKVAPNYTNIINNFQEEYFDYLPLWNGKSSQFTLVVSAGTFYDSFDKVGAFTSEDFFNSLEALRDFVPAKADDRIDVQVKGSEYLITFDKIHPRLIYPSVDLPQKKGAMASYESKTIDMTDDILKLTGSSQYPSYDFANAPQRNDHSNLTIFKRGVIDFKRDSDDSAWVDNKSPHTVVYNDETLYEDNYVWKENVVERNALRRRNFDKTLSKGTLFTRTGFNPPSFLNRVTVKEGYQGVEHEYFPLGLIPSSMTFETIADHVNLPAVYEYCENADSTRIHNGFRTSNAFESRKGTYRTVDGFIVDKDNSTESPIEARYRDNLDSVYDFIYSLVDKKLLKKSEKIISHNSHIFNSGGFKDNLDSVKSALWNDYAKFSFENDFTDVGLNVYKRIPNEDNKGLAYLYQNNYVANGRQNISKATLDDLEYGGSSIISHAYGPLFWNGLLQFDGKYAPTMKSTTIGVEREFDILSLPSVQKTLTSDFSFHENERSVTELLSGIEIVDKKYPVDALIQSKPTKVTLYNLNDNGGFLPEDTSILGKNVFTMKAFSNNPRLRFSFDYDELGNNYLEPEDKFSLEISSLFMDEESYQTDAKSVRVMIRTEAEEDKDGVEVFWAFTTNNKWELFTYDEFSSANTTTKFEKFYHQLSNVSKKLDVNYLKCYPDIPFKKPLYSVTDEDFHVNRVEFNTLNRKIKLPMSYFVPYGRVHRKDQRYVIEVIPEIDSSDDKYWVFRGLKCVDETKSIRAHVEFDETIPDYSMTRDFTDKDLDLLYSDGSSVPFGTLIRIDEEGYLYHGEERLTIALKQWTGKAFLYKSINTEINYDLVTKIPYQGYLKFGNNTKKGLLSLLHIIKLETDIYTNFVKDPAIANSLSSVTDHWKKAWPTRGGLSGYGFNFNYDFNDPNFTLRPPVTIKKTSIPKTTPWGDTVTVIDCSNVAPVISEYTKKFDSYISYYDYGKDLYVSGYLAKDPCGSDDDTYYFSNNMYDAHDFKITQYPGSFYPASYPPGVMDTLRSQDPNVPELLFNDTDEYDDTNTSNGYNNTPFNHRWNIAVAVIDRAAERTHKLPDAVVLSVGTAGWAPQHHFKNFFRVGRQFTANTLGGYDAWGVNPEGRIMFGETISDNQNDYNMSPDSGLFDDNFYFKNEPKNIQGGSFDIANYTLIFLALNVTRCFERGRGAGNVLNDLSGLDNNGNVVGTPGLASRLTGLGEGEPFIPSIGFQNHFDDWNTTELDSENRKCSLPIAHTNTFTVNKDEDYIFDKEFFLNDSNLKATVVDGKDLGTFTTSSITIPYKLTPEELTGLFRFYNLMGDDLQSRDSEISSERYGTNGGGRSSYREHPAAYTNEHDFNVDEKINDLRIKN